MTEIPEIPGNPVPVPPPAPDKTDPVPQEMLPVTPPGPEVERSACARSNAGRLKHDLFTDKPARLPTTSSSICSIWSRSDHRFGSPTLCNQLRGTHLCRARRKTNRIDRRRRRHSE